jgi:hypothetical protein
MKRLALLLVALLIASSSMGTSIKSTFAEYSKTDSIIIHSDGTVTPSSAPIVLNGNTYVVNDDIFIPRTTNYGIIIEKDNIVLDGAGHKLRGHGQSSAILLEGRVGVTITGFRLDNFYWGLEMQNSAHCIITRNNLTALMYPIYLEGSSNNKLHHNNIYHEPFNENSSNTWDDGYPSGGNYWDGYPYPDVKSGPGQNLPNSDGIGDKPVTEEMFPLDPSNTDRYPLMAKVTFLAAATTDLKIDVKDALGKSVSGAYIASTTQPTGQTTLSGLSGTDGTLVFSGILPGSYTVEASKSGYGTATSSAKVVDGSTTVIVLTIQKGVSQTSLKVKVNDGSGKPLTGVIVTSTAQPSGQGVLAGTSGADGVASFSNILVGSYTIQASKSGYVATTSSINAAEGSTMDITISLKAVEATGILKVIVKDNNGVVIVGASVSSTSQPSGQSTLSGTTGTDGVTTFSGVLPGGYTVQASKSGYVSGSAQGNAVSGGTISIGLTLQTQIVGGGGGGGGIPGFPYEAVLIGLALALALLAVNRRS